LFRNLKYIKLTSILTYGFYWLSIKFGFDYKEKQGYERYFYALQNINSTPLFLSRFILAKINLLKNNLNVFLRKGSSDVEVFEQVLVNQEYFPLLEKLSFTGSHNIKIVDCGANIGLSAMYFNLYFKQKTELYLLEPFQDNLSLIKKNLEENSISATVLDKALWTSNGKLSLDNSFRDGKEWSLTVKEDVKGKIQGITLKELMLDLDLTEIDILKVDIEGSEFPVFIESKENLSCLNKVKYLFMEIHDDIGDRKRLYEVLITQNFEIVEFGELTLFINKQFLK